MGTNEKSYLQLLELYATATTRGKIRLSPLVRDVLIGKLCLKANIIAQS
jgi:hypothetical protein